MDTSITCAPTSPNSSCISEEDISSLQDGVEGTASHMSYTSTTSERQSESTLDDLMGEFGEASAPRADIDDFDIEVVSIASNQPSETSEASSSAATGPPPRQLVNDNEGNDGDPAYSYPMGFEMNNEGIIDEDDEDIIPEMEATLMPVRQERSLSFGAAEVIEYEQVLIKDEDLIGADREMNEDDDDDDDEEEDEEIDIHFPMGAADDYRPPIKDHLITSSNVDVGFMDPFEHHHTRTEEDSEDDLDREEIRQIPENKGSYGNDDEELREGAVNRTGFADDVVDDECLDKEEIRNYTEARTKADKAASTANSGKCHYNEKEDNRDREERCVTASEQRSTAQDAFGFDEQFNDEGEGHHHQRVTPVTITSHQSLVLVSTYITVTWCIT